MVDKWGCAYTFSHLLISIHKVLHKSWCIFLCFSSSKFGLPALCDTRSFCSLWLATMSSLKPTFIRLIASFSLQRFSIPKAIFFNSFFISTNLLSDIFSFVNGSSFLSWVIWKRVIASMWKAFWILEIPLKIRTRVQNTSKHFWYCINGKCNMVCDIYKYYKDKFTLDTRLKKNKQKKSLPLHLSVMRN